jgi:hypothetical protein
MTPPAWATLAPAPEANPFRATHATEAAMFSSGSSNPWEGEWRAGGEAEAPSQAPSQAMTSAGPIVPHRDNILPRATSRALANVAASYAATSHPSSGSLPAPSPMNLAVPPAKAGWLHKEGHVTKGWKRRWCVVENGLLQYFESFDSPREKYLGMVPLQGASIREPKSTRVRRSSMGVPVGPAWRLDTAAKAKKDAFHSKYILAGEDVESSRKWREALQVHIEFANDAARPSPSPIDRGACRQEGSP